ncbi:MAG TPA: hypothetical protein VGG89_02270 [Candidatus Baltobacteraceae bacterium]|jgi:hypothetical protein
MRLTKCTLTAVLAVGLASCSGGGSPLNPATPQYPNAQQPILNQTATPARGTMHPNTSSTYLTLTGDITGLFTGGFVLDTGSSQCYKLHIYTHSNTTISGGKLAAGENAKVYGQGSCTALSATTITIGSGSSTTTVQKHILTADYLGRPYGTTSVSWTSAAPYLTWAQAGPTYANAIHDAGIKTEYYADPNVTTSGAPMFTGTEAAFAHNCSGSRLTYSYDGHQMYIMNIGSSTMQSLFSTYTAGVAGTAHYDAVFEDNAGPLGGLTGDPCGYNDSTWLTYGRSLNQVSRVPVIFNGLSAFHNEGMSLSVGLLSSANTIGGNLEHCYSDNATPKMHTWVWQATESTELYISNYGKIFECMLRNSNTASSSYDARIYALASFLLTYNPAHSVLWEEFATPSGLRVMPETELVPMNPTISPSSLSSLKLSSGTYARQYAKCYLRGSYVGACAVVVNSDTVAHSFPYTTYHHTLTLSGNGVLDGGSVYTTGGPPPTTLPAMEARIVFP